MPTPSLYTRFLHSFVTSGIPNPGLALATQLLVINIYSLVTVVAAGSFGIWHLFHGNAPVGSLEIAAAVVVLGNALLLRATKHVNLACDILLVSAVGLLIVLFMSGGFAMTGIFWFFVFPVAAFFLVGRAQGLLWIALLYVVILLLTVLGQLQVVHIAYSADEIRQLLVSLAVVTLGIYIYERTREQADATAIDLEAHMQGNERSLHEAQNRAEAIIENIGEGIVVSDGHGTITLVNQAAEDLLGWSLGEMRDASFTAHFMLCDEVGAPLPVARQPLQVVLRQGKSARQKGQLTRKNGRLFDTVVTTTPIITDGQVVGAIAVFHDVTDERRIERAKSEFVTLASHQLRTPIAAIAWLSELLLEDEEKFSSEHLEHIKQIYRSNKRLAQLVSQMLLLSSVELGQLPIQPESVDVAALAKRVLDGQVAALSKSKELHIKAHFDPALSRVSLDEEITKIILQQVIGNSLKYTPEGGCISIELVKGTNDFSLVISDNGYGIPKHQHGKVFSKFFRAENITSKDTDGSGLGLYVVKALLDYVGGAISFDSTEEKGTTFVVTLPLAGMRSSKAEERPSG